ncbi:MAG: NAD-dependent dehydratase [Pelagibacteraceae bacterium]|nr:NAD-dependent dehydratase [Pelagibacteraceae bacterium]
MKIFVTGASGFIGSHLVEKLVNNGHKVKALVPYNIDNNWGWIDTFEKKIKKKIEIIQGDVSDQNLVLRETKNFEIIFHLAALISIPYSYKSPRSYITTNVIGTLNILEAARVNKTKKIIITSTSEVYGSAKYIPIDEKHSLNAQSPYAASKIAADQISLSYSRSFGIPLTIIRPFNTFGPRQSQRAAIPTIIAQILMGKKVIKLGNLKSSRDFTLVEDTVNGFIKTINNKKCIGEVINLGTGSHFTIKETVNMISTIVGKKIKVIVDKKRIRPKKSEVDRLLSKNLKAKKILGWKPKYTGKKGFYRALKITINWFKNPKNLKLYKSDIYNV